MYEKHHDTFPRLAILAWVSKEISSATPVPSCTASAPLPALTPAAPPARSAAAGERRRAPPPWLSQPGEDELHAESRLTRPSGPAVSLVAPKESSAARQHQAGGKPCISH